MKNVYEIFKAKLFSTEYKKWKRITEVILFSLISILPVIALSVIIFQANNWFGFLYAAVFWCITELTVIGYIYHSTSLPYIIRTAMQLSIAISNMWFAMFIASLGTVIFNG